MPKTLSLINDGDVPTATIKGQRSKAKGGGIYLDGGSALSVVSGSLGSES